MVMNFCSVLIYFSVQMNIRVSSCIEICHNDNFWRLAATINESSQLQITGALFSLNIEGFGGRNFKVITTEVKSPYYVDLFYIVK